MALSTERKRKLAEKVSSKPPRKIRKQKHYSSSSASSASEATDEFTAVDLADSDPKGTDEGAVVPENLLHRTKTPNETSSGSDSEIDSDESESSNPNHVKLSQSKSKRNDPDAFASSISAILGSKLSASKRCDPVLARSATAAEANLEIGNTRLETKAKRKLRDDKKQALEKGRIKDVLLGTKAVASSESTSANRQHGMEGSVGEMQELEKKLRKTAQKGVIKLFNAVRQAQIRGEEAGKKGGSRSTKEERVSEMSKKGFLELVSGGGSEKQSGQGRLEEA